MTRNGVQDGRLPSIMSGSTVTDEVRAAWREAAREADNELLSQEQDAMHPAGQYRGRKQSVSSDGSGLPTGAHWGRPAQTEKGLAHSSGPTFTGSEDPGKGQVNHKDTREIDLTGTFVHSINHQSRQTPSSLAHLGGPDAGVDITSDQKDSRASERLRQGCLTREALQEALEGMSEQGDHDRSPLEQEGTHWGEKGPASREVSKELSAMNDPVVPREFFQEDIAREVIRVMTGLLSTQNKSVNEPALINESAAPQGQTDHGNPEYRVYHSEPNVRAGPRFEAPCRAYKSAPELGYYGNPPVYEDTNNHGMQAEARPDPRQPPAGEPSLPVQYGMSAGPAWQDAAPSPRRNAGAYTWDRRSEPKVHMLQYGGKVEWKVYWLQFELIARRFGWSLDQTLDRLVSSLKDSALEYYADLPGEVRTNLTSLIAAMERRFGDHKLPQVYKASLNTISKGNKETLMEYAARVDKTVRRAHPNLHGREGEAHMEETTVEKLLDGYPDQAIAYEVRTKDPRTVQRTLELLQWHEICKGVHGKRAGIRQVSTPSAEVGEVQEEASVRRMGGKAAVTEEKLNHFGRELLAAIKTKQESGDPQPHRRQRRKDQDWKLSAKCHICHEIGHIKYDCPEREAKPKGKPQRRSPREQKTPAEAKPEDKGSDSDF